MHKMLFIFNPKITGFLKCCLRAVVYDSADTTCADPEGGPGVWTPLEFEKNYLKKVISGFLGGWTPPRL